MHDTSRWRWFAGLACIGLALGCVDDEALDTADTEQPIGLSGTLSYGPASVRTGPDTVDVFVAGGDFKLYTRRLTESTKSWSAWQQVEGSVIIGSGLAAVTDAAGGVKVFASNRTTLTATISMLALTWTGTGASGWSVAAGWQNLPSSFSMTGDAPAATRDPAGTIHLFSRDETSNRLMHTACTSCTAASPTWAAWDNTDQYLTVYSTPAVVSPAVGEFNLYFRDKTGRLREGLYRPNGPPLYLSTWSTRDLNVPDGMWPYTTGTATTADYTVSTAVPVDTSQGAHSISNVRTNPAYVSNTSGSCGGAGEEAVMQLVLPQPARVRIDTAGAGYDTVLYVRAANGTTQVTDRDGVTGCNDDSGGTLQSALDLRLAAGTYYVFLDGYSAGAPSAGKQPTVHASITYFNAPAAVSRGGAVDIYSIADDNRLYVMSRYPGGLTDWSLINGPEPLGDGGDYQNTGVLGATLNSANTCSYIFARSFPWQNLIYKGCGETASWSLDNLAGGVFTSSWAGPVPNFSANPFDAGWGPVNSAWNQTVNFGGAGNATGNSAVYFTARWPTELYAFDFDDYRTVGPDWSLTAPHHYANLLGYLPPTPSGFLPAADHGAEVTSKAMYLPGGVKAVRIIDHGSCSRRIPWVGPHGLLEELKAQLNDALYMGMATSLFASGEHGGTYTWDYNKFEPSFAHFSWDPVTGIHSDGFAFQSHLHYSSSSGDAWAHTDAQYTFGLEKGVPHIYPLRAVGSTDHSGFYFNGLGLIFDWAFSGFGSDHYVATHFMAHGEPGCDKDLNCTLANGIPSMLADTTRAQMTAMIGDPLKAQVCGNDTDCPSGHSFTCHNNYCMIAIQPDEPGYLASSPSSNFRTEWDRLDAGGLLDGNGHIDNRDGQACTPVPIGTVLEGEDLANCKLELQGAVGIALGLSPVSEVAHAAVAGIKDYQFGCVAPTRPNCGGDGTFTSTTGYYGGYPCRDGAVTPGTAYTGHLGGRCTWRPAFKRLNVLPTALEVVWSEAGEPASPDEKVVKALSPGQACVDPRLMESDVSTATALPRISTEGVLP